MAPRLVRKIVFGYDSALPASMVIGAEQLKGNIQRAGLKVSVVCRPLYDLPEDTDVLLVAEEVVRTAQQRVPTAEVIPLKQFVNNPTYRDLVTRLLEGMELKAEAEDATEEASGPRTVKYRGYHKIG